jgi:hypothetical protein
MFLSINSSFAMFNYRAEIKINNTGSALTNYTININFNTNQLGIFFDIYSFIITKIKLNFDMLKNLY